MLRSNSSLIAEYRGIQIRPWQSEDRQAAAALIRSVLAEYGLGWEPEDADRDVLDIEECYWAIGGEFWVLTRQGELVGTGAYYPIARGKQAVEIRKMYLAQPVRGQGLGRFLLATLEARIVSQGFAEIWVETASILRRAVQLYETSGYHLATGVETARCDRVYRKVLI